MHYGRHFWAGGVSYPLNHIVRTPLAKRGWCEVASNGRHAGGGPRVEVMVVPFALSLTTFSSFAETLKRSR